MFPQTVIVTGNGFTELLVLNSWAMGTRGGNPKGGQGCGICSDQTHEAPCEGFGFLSAEWRDLQWMLWKAVISCSLRTPFLLHQKAESNFPPLESRRTCGSLVTERMEQKLQGITSEVASASDLGHPLPLVPSFDVRNPLHLRPPYCAEAQAQRRGCMQVFQQTAPAEVPSTAASTPAVCEEMPPQCYHPAEVPDIADKLSLLCPT